MYCELGVPHLQPAAGGGAQVQHSSRIRQEVELAVQLDELEGGTGAEAAESTN